MIGRHCGRYWTGPMAPTVAWAPTREEPGAQISAVLCHPEQALDRELYLSLLGDRIQRMIDASPDPQGATNELANLLFEQGLLADAGHVPAEEAGNRLVWSNPAIEERLGNRNLLSKIKAAKPHEMPEARKAILADQADPLTRLLSWGSAIAQLP